MSTGSRGPAGGYPFEEANLAASAMPSPRGAARWDVEAVQRLLGQASEAATLDLSPAVFHDDPALAERMDAALEARKTCGHRLATGPVVTISDRNRRQ